ncbi:MAG: cbb3-type cytochrome c oxidase subunit I [Candidatus Eremiobacteraeota bacterium]|nr:cbb3-type cytochrome c oxidase subunit I [Candidatus Eremiobacteraeota bacterium]
MIGWLTSTNHKNIGILYIVTTMTFFVAAGALALLIRSQLAFPGNTFLGPHAFNQAFTLHGTAMIFLVIAPFGIGLANYLVPLQIGAPDMAFPRLNATSFWLFAIGGLTVFGGLLAYGGAAATGWTAYVPLSEIAEGTGAGQDLWIVGLTLVAVSTVLTAINLLVTAVLYRAPGMTMWRMPIFTWEVVATAVLILMAFPPLTAAFAMLLIDRHTGGHFFDPTYGGNPVLYQHLFWFFGHPEVYVMILPFFGVVTEVVATFSHKPVFGYVGMVISAFAIAGLSIGVWAHHMFTTGAVSNPFFSAVSFLIAVPTGVKFVNWIGTMWKGAIELSTAMLFAIGFMLNFLIGGITGVMVASPPLDYGAHDTYFIVQHFHYTIGGGSLFALFAALFFWFPKMFGIRLGEGMGKWSFALLFVGFNATFLPMGFMGLEGMARRVYTYPDVGHLALLNGISTAGSVVMAVGVALFFVNVLVSALLAKPVPDNPWNGYSLEWLTSSPPPEFNFHTLPRIQGKRPAWDVASGAAP